MQRSLLLDYLTHIKMFSNHLKYKMYVLLIKLLNSTKNFSEDKEGQTEEVKLSTSEEDIIQFILVNDRESFFDVIKQWIYYEYNEYLCNNGGKFEVLLIDVLKKIISSKLYLNSNKWISFILSQPAYPKVIFNHIFDVWMESIQKDVPAIKLLQKFLMSNWFKLSIKKDCTKLLLKWIISTPKNINIKKQAALSLLIAHAHGIFQFDKMDVLRNYMHYLLDHFFEKASTEAQKSKKKDIHNQLVYLICSIVLDNTLLQKIDSEEQERIDKSKFFYFGLIFKHFNHMEEETKALLLKQYFYKLIGGEKFKESSNKPIYGPLTKAEFKSGLKHPIKYEENPLLDLLKFSLQYVGKDEHDWLLEFIKILKSKAKLTNDVGDLILRVSILNDGYNDIIKETFSTTFKIPNVQRQIKSTSKEDEQKSELSILLWALLEQNRNIFLLI